MSHSIGPWIIGKRYGNNRTEVLNATQSHAVATVWTHDRNRIDKPSGHPDDFGESPDGMANLRLIAAAPELLDVVQRMSAGMAWKQLHPIAQAALAKVRGKATA